MLSMVNMMKRLLLIGFLLGIISILNAATILVPTHYATIQQAVNSSSNGDVVIVLPGTYKENINMNGRAITLRSSNPQDGSVVTATVIDGNNAGSSITCDSGEGPNTVIKGFTIINGLIHGGIYNLDSSPTIENCVFQDNSADIGGGMLNQNASPYVFNCTFVNNTIGLGGGIGNMYSAPVIQNCRFLANSAVYGGAICNYESSPEIIDCTFEANFAEEYGGAICNYEASSIPIIKNCRFCSNSPDPVYGSIDVQSTGNIFANYCPPSSMSLGKRHIPGDIDASGSVNMNDFAILSDPMQILFIIAENWLEIAD